MYKYELVTLLEKVLMKSYQMKNGEHAFHCPFCNHHKPKLEVDFTDDYSSWTSTSVSSYVTKYNKNLYA